MRPSAWFLPLAVATTAIACSSQLPLPVVVKQATPSPLVGAKAFVVAPVAFNGFTWEGKPEAEWQATRSQEQRDNWQADKVKMTENVIKYLNVNGSDGEHYAQGAQAAAGQFLVAINVDTFDGEFRWTAEIRDPAGQSMDVIRDSHSTTNHFNTWVGELVFASNAGGTIAQYVHRRSSPTP